MIVCRECGTHNDDDDLFCGGCPAFLEHSGEHIDDDPLPIVDEPEPEAEPAGLVDRIKHAIVGDHDEEEVHDADRDDDATLSGDATTTETVESSPASKEQTPDKDADVDAEDDVGTTDDADRRRAAALVAKPVEEVAAAPSTSTRDGASSSDSAVGARGPQAQKPRAAQPRPKTAKRPPSRRIMPGDLICGQCGEGNPETRKFCRRCGSSLVEAVVAKEPWYRRIIPRRKKKTLRATERPERGRNDQVGTKARLFRGKVLGKMADARRVIAILAIVGIGVGLALPSSRSAMLDAGDSGLTRVRRVVSPTYSNIPIDPDRVSASSAASGAPPEAVTDSNTLTFWVGLEGVGPASVSVRFVEVTDVEHVLVHPGQQENGGKVIRPDPRPRSLLFRVLDDDGVVTEVDKTLEDEDGFQTVELGVRNAVSVETVVIDCFPDPVVTVCPITELEFQEKD